MLVNKLALGVLDRDDGRLLATACTGQEFPVGHGGYPEISFDGGLIGPSFAFPVGRHSLDPTLLLIVAALQVSPGDADRYMGRSGYVRVRESTADRVVGEFEFAGAGPRPSACEGYFTQASRSRSSALGAERFRGRGDSQERGLALRASTLPDTFGSIVPAQNNLIESASAHAWPAS
ncbi:MAG TPA: hypothetical protein VF006_16475 [Longimicrobium sp.]